MDNATTNLVFVYGSLRKGYGNHRLLQDSEFKGYHNTEPAYTMYSLGPFPMVGETGHHSIVGEVYEVDEDTALALDNLEGYPHFYDRIIIDTEHGPAWMYVGGHTGQIVESGDWTEHREAV